MITFEITRDDFIIGRTPKDLARYVQETYDYIDQNRELRSVARLRKGPDRIFKIFLEELMPFSHFCTWKYGDRDDILCALVQETPGKEKPRYDGIVIDKATGNEHTLEITCPIDGKQVICDGKQLNENGMTDVDIWDYNDISRQQAAIDLTLKKAEKKALRDYHSAGGSSLIFVFDHRLFWDSNPKHAELLTSLKTKLSLINFQADDVLLMLIYGEQKRIIEVKKT